MARSKESLVHPGKTAKARHKKAARKIATSNATQSDKDIGKGKKKAIKWDDIVVPDDMVIKPPSAPRSLSKHTTYIEFVKNKGKKKKLEFKVINTRTPPPGFEFVPAGMEELTTACKELSREQDAMVFIVSDCNAEALYSFPLSVQTQRVGHHIRQSIVEEIRATLGNSDESFMEGIISQRPEPIPRSQNEINQQADKALKILFPRIPNFDRLEIIRMAFQKNVDNEHTKVGLASDIPLSRRVQAATLAYIRHKYTRYEAILRERGWQFARKAVHSACLECLIKWRGDDENGRDQLDEIIREVVVISDDEEDDSLAEDSTTPAEDPTTPTDDPTTPADDPTTSVEDPTTSAEAPTTSREVSIKRKELDEPSLHSVPENLFPHHPHSQDGLSRQLQEILDRLPLIPSQTQPIASYVDGQLGQPFRELPDPSRLQLPMDLPSEIRSPLEQPGPQPSQLSSLGQNQEASTWSNASYMPQADRVARPNHDELKDYLVPSIEDDPSGPRFIRPAHVAGQHAGASPLNLYQASSTQLTPRMATLGQVQQGQNAVRYIGASLSAQDSSPASLRVDDRLVYRQMPVHNAELERQHLVPSANFQDYIAQGCNEPPRFVRSVPQQGATSMPSNLTTWTESSIGPRWQLPSELLPAQGDFGQGTLRPLGNYGHNTPQAAGNDYLVTYRTSGGYGHNTPQVVGNPYRVTHQTSGEHGWGSQQPLGTYPQPMQHQTPPKNDFEFYDI